MSKGSGASLSGVTAVAVDLAADFAARPPGAVNVYISGSGTNRLDQFVEFSGGNPSFIREISNVRCHNRA